MAARKPTLDHYAQWINDHLQRSLTEIGQAVTAVASRHSAKGAYQSGATVVVTYQEAHALFEKEIRSPTEMNVSVIVRAPRLPAPPCQR